MSIKQPYYSTVVTIYGKGFLKYLTIDGSSEDPLEVAFG